MGECKVRQMRDWCAKYKKNVPRRSRKVSVVPRLPTYTYLPYNHLKNWQKRFTFLMAISLRGNGIPVYQITYLQWLVELIVLQMWIVQLILMDHRKLCVPARRKKDQWVTTWFLLVKKIHHKLFGKHEFTMWVELWSMLGWWLVTSWARQTYRRNLFYHEPIRASWTFIPCQSIILSFSH